jgi:hypothetical protein
LPFLNHGDGQPFDHPSLFHGPPAEKQPRDRRGLRDQLARSVAGVAKAEAGVLILAIEHDLTIRGHQLHPQAVASLLDVPQARCQPPLPGGSACGARLTEGPLRGIKGRASGA